MSERRACVVIRLQLGTYRYQSHKDPRRELRMREIATVRVRYGCRKILVLLQREGWAVGKTMISRLYREEGLALRRTVPRKRRVAVERRERSKATGPNQAWSLDFVTDQLADGRRFWALTVVDVYTRESLAMEPGQSLKGQDVVRVLQSIQRDRGRPKRLFCDNGPEFTSKAMHLWSQRTGVTLRFIQPGKPIQNALVESFNGKFRDACLNEHWFLDLADARRTIKAWRIHYNTVRPHSLLGFLTPERFRAAGDKCCGKAGPSGTLENSSSFPLFPQPRRRYYLRAINLGVGPFYSIKVGSFYVVKATPWATKLCSGPIEGVHNTLSQDGHT